MSFKAIKPGPIPERWGAEEDSPRPARLRDRDLVALAQKKFHGAIEELIRRYQDKAYGVAYQMCAGDPEEARDLTQEAFLKVLRNIGKFQFRSSFYTWFYRIVVNTCLDAGKRRRRWFRFFQRPPARDQEAADPLADLPDQRKDGDPLAVVAGKQLNHRIRRILATLPEKQQMVFHLKVFHEMSIREIAEIMGAAEGTVKSHLFRATRSLRAHLQDWVPGGSAQEPPLVGAHKGRSEKL